MGLRVHNAVLGTKPFDKNLQIDFFKKMAPLSLPIHFNSKIFSDGLFQKLGIH